MKTTAIASYEMPAFLPHGWQKKVAERNGWHRNTVYNVKKRGESHPFYGRMQKTMRELYGKPVAMETV